LPQIHPIHHAIADQIRAPRHQPFEELRAEDAMRVEPVEHVHRRAEPRILRHPLRD
jgi:hypothetical protein